VTVISGGGSSLGFIGFVKLRGDIHGNDEDEVTQLCCLCLQHWIIENFMKIEFND
jgi:hypothetical protein